MKNGAFEHACEGKKCIFVEREGDQERHCYAYEGAYYGMEREVKVCRGSDDAKHL